MKFRTSLVIPLLFLSACEVGPDYKKPELAINNSWDFFNYDAAPKLQAENATNKNLDNPKWWENFNDPQLNDLVTRAEKSNFDVKAAVARIKQARANRLGAIANLLPEVDGTATATRQKSRELPVATPFNDYEAGFDAMWEVDLFGGNRRREEAAESQLEAARAEKDNVLVSLRAEIARNYFEARNYQNQIKITEDNIKSQSDSYDLTIAQRNAGVVSDLDVNQAATIFNTTKARLPALKTAFEVAKNNISVLLGEQTGKLNDLFAEQKKVPVAQKDFLITTPARAISERPDVKSAERQLAATSALEGAAIAGWFPNLSLSAMFGYEHNNLQYGPGVTLKPGSVFTLGASTALPLIDFGRIRSQVNLAKAENEEAMANYQKTVYSALGEIQSDLVTYANEQRTYEALKAANDASQKSLDFARARYNSGISSFTDVLVAQRDLYTAQSQLANSEANIGKNLIAINKALGR